MCNCDSLKQPGSFVTWVKIDLNKTQFLIIDKKKLFLPSGIVSPEVIRLAGISSREVYPYIHTNSPHVNESDLTSFGTFSNHRTVYRSDLWCFCYLLEDGLFYLMGLRKRNEETNKDTGTKQSYIDSIIMRHHNNAGSSPGEKVKIGLFNQDELYMLATPTDKGWWVRDFYPGWQTVVQAYDSDGNPTSLHYFSIPRGIYQGMTPGGSDKSDEIHGRINGKLPDIVDIVMNDRSQVGPDKIKHHLIEDTIIAESTYNNLIQSYNDTGLPTLIGTNRSPFPKQIQIIKGF